MDDDDELMAGGCACGAVRFVVRAMPRRAGLCHCLTCQKAHGAAFNPFIVFAAADVVVEGGSNAWASSPDYDRLFCGNCGSRVAGRNGDEIELSAGSFDEPPAITPQYECWVGRRLDWVRPLAVPQYERNRT